MTQKRCYLCSSGNLENKGKIGIINFKIVKIIHCLECGSYFADPMPGRDDIKKIYIDDYYYSEDPTVGFKDYLKGSSGHLRDGKYLGRKLLKIKNKGNFLDYGCGTGFFLLGIKLSSKWNVFGVEIPDMAVRFANKVLKILVKKGGRSRIDFKNSFFEYVYCNHVLEHMSNPAALLKEFYRVLKPGGRLFLGLPNGLCDVSSVLRANKRGEIPHTGQPHLFFISPKILLKIMEEMGFEIKKAYTRKLKTGLQDLGVIPRKIFKKKKKYNPERSQADKKQVGKNKETEINYELYKNRVFDIINKRNIKSSMAYACYKNIKKRMIKIPLSMPLGHCLEIIAVKKS